MGKSSTYLRLTVSSHERVWHPLPLTNRSISILLFGGNLSLRRISWTSYASNSALVVRFNTKVWSSGTSAWLEKTKRGLQCSGTTNVTLYCSGNCTPVLHLGYRDTRTGDYMPPMCLSCTAPLVEARDLKPTLAVRRAKSVVSRGTRVLSAVRGAGHGSP